MRGGGKWELISTDPHILGVLQSPGLGTVITTCCESDPNCAVHAVPHPPQHLCILRLLQVRGNRLQLVGVPGRWQCVSDAATLFASSHHNNSSCSLAIISCILERESWCMDSFLLSIATQTAQWLSYHTYIRKDLLLQGLFPSVHHNSSCSLPFIFCMYINSGILMQRSIAQFYAETHLSKILSLYFLHLILWLSLYPNHLMLQPISIKSICITWYFVGHK